MVNLEKIVLNNGTRTDAGHAAHQLKKASCRKSTNESCKLKRPRSFSLSINLFLQ
jgi:hypothetical protein